MARQSGSAWAHDVVVREQPKLLRFFRWQVRKLELAEDLAQEAVCILLATGGLAENGDAIGDPTKFLWGIARQLGRMAFRRKPDEPFDPDSPPAGSAALPVPGNVEERLAARVALRRVADNPRNEFLVLQGMGWTGDELAQRRRSSVEAVRTHLADRRRQLRPLLDEDQPSRRAA